MWGAYLISTYFELDYAEVFNNIKHLNSKIGIDNIKDYKYDVDVVLSLNNTIINVEMNKSYWKGILIRNLLYGSNIFGRQVKSGTDKKDFRNAKKLIQINLNNYNYPKYRELSIARLMDIETKEEITDLIEIHNINLVKIKEKCYSNVNELNNIEKIGKFLTSTKVSELKRIVGEGMDELIDKIVELSNDENIIGLYDKEDLERQIKESLYDEGLEKGHKQGLSEGRKQGKIEGINQEKKEIAKKLIIYEHENRRYI